MDRRQSLVHKKGKKAVPVHLFGMNSRFHALNSFISKEGRLAEKQTGIGWERRWECSFHILVRMKDLKAQVNALERSARADDLEQVWMHPWEQG